MVDRGRTWLISDQDYDGNSSALKMINPRRKFFPILCPSRDRESSVWWDINFFYSGERLRWFTVSENITKLIHLRNFAFEFLHGTTSSLQ